MQPLDFIDVYNYVNKNIVRFHKSKIDSLCKLKLKTILKRKNPYLFKAKNILRTQDLIKALLDAYLSSQEEAIFGEFLEGLAIFINNKVYNGKKSAAEGIDLEFEKEGIIYIVSIKSGPNWGNSEQIRKLRESFKKAIRILRTNNPKIHVIPVNGCCYGKNANNDRGDYIKLCGQEFWSFISNNEDLYVQIIEPLGYEAKGHNELFLKEYSKIINLFTLEFSKLFCIDGEIDWAKLVKFNSGKN